ncbi:hypothetical protein ACFQ1L_08535 [Phytohabitans flavus]|uniref:hypothetical protein n=1 Tax=Phytohabitans flavus TaxID=1076124 RepID=UPI0036395489
MAGPPARSAGDRAAAGDGTGGGDRARAGRLYRRAKARGPTADLLRAAARDRLTQLLAPTAGASLVDAAAAAARWDPEQIEGLLDGPTPESDDDLRRLQSDLDALVEAIRRAR